MKALLDFIGIFILFLILMFTFNVGDIRNEAIESIEKYENMVGKKMILENDTLLIIDYSWVNSNFTLSDGKIISYQLINDSTLIK